VARLTPRVEQSGHCVETCPEFLDTLPDIAIRSGSKAAREQIGRWMLSDESNRPTSAGLGVLWFAALIHGIVRGYMSGPEGYVVKGGRMIRWISERTQRLRHAQDLPKTRRWTPLQDVQV
jgi:hypothetical protein